MNSNFEENNTKKIVGLCHFVSVCIFLSLTLIIGQCYYLCIGIIIRL
jgi:hypothetical protein